jgi:hypothetical protein
MPVALPLCAKPGHGRISSTPDDKLIADAPLGREFGFLTPINALPPHSAKVCDGYFLHLP